jgi:Predicted O-methyltransferase
MKEKKTMKVNNFLLGYKDLHIIQDPSMFSFSLDSVLLPNFITITKKVNKVLDIGCGNAPIPLILSTKLDCKIIGVEIQKEVYNLAVESVEINNKTKQIEIINADINEISKEWESCSFGIITCNPPFFRYSEDSNINESDYKTIARHEKHLNLEQLLAICKKLLDNNGVFGMVHRPERLVEILEVMKKNGIEPKKVQFIYPRPNEEANILLIEGRKNGKPGLKIMPPLFSHEENGEYTEEIKKFFQEN